MNKFSLAQPGSSITIIHEENTSHAVVVYSGFSGVGTAKCQESDKFSEDIGKGIALARAMRDLGERMEKVWVERSIPNREWRKSHKKSAS